ncbi:MAG TPA: hypothetical protein ENJ54_04345 [Chloroflexi bacterium]|nr:hypothetical protein [Chloroflexota bacterium]
MAKRVHAPKTPKPKQPERPRPHGWHEWLANARREAEGGKRPHGKAVVSAARTPHPRRRYSRVEWQKMTLIEKVNALAEAVGIVNNVKSPSL